MNLEKELAELHGMLFALQTTRGNLVCQWQKFYYIFLSALKKMFPNVNEDGNGS